MGKSGQDLISSSLSGRPQQFLFHLALTYQFHVLSKFRKRICQTMSYWLRPQITTPLIGGKAGINTKTKIPSHIRRKWPGLKLNAWRCHIKCHELSSQLTFPLYSSFSFSAASKLSVLIHRQSLMQTSFKIKRQLRIKPTSFLRQLPQCLVFFRTTQLVS